MSFDVYDCCLEFLASQCDLVVFEHLLSSVLSENQQPELDTSSKINVWIKLYQDPNVLVLSDQPTDVLYEHLDSLASSETQGVTHDVESSNVDNAAEANRVINIANRVGESSEEFLISCEQAFVDYINKSRLSVSNALRIQKLNLFHNESLVRSSTRFSILMAIASKRYNGYWQHEIVQDFGITPKDLFSHMVHLSKASLVCRVSVPQDCVSRKLVLEKYEEQKVKSKVKGFPDGDNEARPGSTHVAILWFHTRYFILDRLPEWIQEVCFNRQNEDTDARMLRILEETPNRIIMESDWKAAYCSILLESVPGSHPNVDNRMFAKSFWSFRKSLENKCMITRIFAWCPQTNRYERCIIPYAGASDLGLPDLNATNSNNQHVIDLQSQSSGKTGAITKDTLSHKPNPLIYQSPDLMYGHTLSEFIYYLVRCHPEGIGINDINKHLGLPYKMATKLVTAIESKGIFVKRPYRDGKLLMNLYSVSPKFGDAPTLAPELKAKMSETANSEPSELSIDTVNVEASNVGASPGDLQATDEGNAEPPIQERLGIPPKPIIVPITGNLEYDKWIAVHRAALSNDASYEAYFNDLFGVKFNLPKQLNTAIFRRRMVLLTLYIEHFHAASCNTISLMYGHMDPSYGKKVDRKTVTRVVDVVVQAREHIQIMKAHELEGVKISISIIFDSRHVDGLGAYRLVNEDLQRKRQLSCMHVSNLQRHVNTSFKGPSDATGEEAVSLATHFETVVDNVKMVSTTLVKGVSVTKQEMPTKNKTKVKAFSQKSLSTNGYIFPVVTRVKCLHKYLLETCRPKERYTALQLLQSMPIDTYFQVIGYGHPLRNVLDLLDGNVLPVHIEDGCANILYGSRNRRAPVYIIRRLLQILTTLGLLVVHTTPVDSSQSVLIPECHMEWEIVTTVKLYSLTDPTSVVGKFELPHYCNKFWQALQAEVDAYIDSNHDDIPASMPIRELFLKKNWKRSVYNGNLCRGHLERTVSGWFRSICHGLDHRKLSKTMYMPDYLISIICQRHNISHEQLFNYITHRIRSVGSHSLNMNVPAHIVSYVKDMNSDREFLWLAKFVLAERLCNAIFYDKVSSCSATASDGPITWGSLRQKLIDAQMNYEETTKRRRLNEDRTNVEEQRDAAETASESELKSLDTTASTRAQSSTLHNDPVSSLDNGEESEKVWKLDRIWCMLSLLFDNEFSPSACRYIFDHILDKSVLCLRLIRRLRHLSSSDVMHSAMKCHMPTYRCMTNKLTVSDPMKCCMKSMLFTPVVSMRPWFLRNLTELRRGRSLLRQWSDSGWVVRTKQTSNIYTLFRLSTLAKVKLFGKFNDLYFTAKVLGSHLCMYTDALETFETINLIPKDEVVLSPDNEDYAVGTHGKKRSLLQMSSSIGASNLLGPISCLRNCDEMSMHDIYAMMDHYVHGFLSFKPVWTKDSFPQSLLPKRHKISNDRLNDGGISRHIRELTSETATIASVSVGCSIPSFGLPDGLILEDKSLCSSISDCVLNHEIVCASSFSDALFPPGCPSSCLTSRVHHLYPLINLEYASDARHQWWSSSQYKQYRFPPSMYKTQIEDHAPGIPEAADTRPSEECHVNSLTRKADLSDSSGLQSLVTKVISALYGHNNGMLDPMLPDIDSYLYGIILIVKSSGNAGIRESDLYCKFSAPFISSAESGHPVPMEMLSLVWTLFNVMVVSAEVLRYINRVASNDEFVYYYWDKQCAIFITPEPIVAVRQYGKQAKEDKDINVLYSIFKCPEYIPPLFWLLYEEFRDHSLELEGSWYESSRISTLLENEDEICRFKAHRLKSPLCSFVSLDGHLNRCMLAFVMLKIAALLKNVPGQTAEEVWEKLVLFDLCEVRTILEGMSSIGICRRLLTDRSILPNSSFSGVVNPPPLLTYFLLEECSWLHKFSPVLLPYRN